MSDIENTNKQDMEGELRGQPSTGEQGPFQHLLRLQSDIEVQSRRVAMAVNLVAEAIGKGGRSTPQMMHHLKAQILLAHLQLDELEQLFDAMD